MKKKIHIGTSQSTKMSVEEVKRKQKEREDLKKDFFERLKILYVRTLKKKEKYIRERENLWVFQRFYKSNEVPVFEDDKNFKKIFSKFRR